MEKIRSWYKDENTGGIAMRQIKSKTRIATMDCGRFATRTKSKFLVSPDYNRLAATISEVSGFYVQMHYPFEFER